MEELRSLGLSCNVAKSEFAHCLTNQPAERLKCIRFTLFLEAKENGLTHPRDVPVGRRDNATNPIHGKLAADIWTLSNAILNNLDVPRTLVKNGKKSIAGLDQWRNSQACTSRLTSLSTLSSLSDETSASAQEMALTTD